MYRIPFALTIILFTIGLVACDQQDGARMVGTLERNRVEIRVESSEPIVNIHVADGQKVTAGTPILSQDPSRAEASIRKLQGVRDQSAARLAELRRGPRPEGQAHRVPRGLRGGGRGGRRPCLPDRSPDPLRLASVEVAPVLGAVG